MRSTKGLTVQSLRDVTNGEIIRAIVQDQVKLIDAKILTVHHAGFNKMEYELPTNFSINGLEKADAQTIIYSELLKIYMTDVKDGGKGFNVKIEISVASKLHISWPNMISDTEREERKRLLQQHRKK